VEVGHLYVEEEKVRLERQDALDRLPPAGARGDDRGAAALLEHSNQPPSGYGFIVGYDRGDRSHPAAANETPVALSSAVACSSRRRRSGVVPSSSVVSRAARK